MIYYPVYIPTLNRYTHFKRCVESLAKNTHADKTELVIGLDYPPSEKYQDGYEKIKTYIPTITGFRKVTVFEREENYGVRQNGLRLLDYIFSNYDAAIGTEDDNEFSPCFLDFMNKALNYYKDDKRVVTVSGYIDKQYYGRMNKPLMFNYDNNGWGQGIWRYKNEEYLKISDNYLRSIIFSIKKSWKVFCICPGIFSMYIDMLNGNLRWGDVTRTILSMIDGTYQLRPSFSMVRNNGYDGSGLNCGDGDPDNLSHQEISKEQTFNYDVSDVEPVDSPAIRDVLHMYLMPTDIFKRIHFLFFLGLRYLKLRIKLSKMHFEDDA